MTLIRILLAFLLVISMSACVERQATKGSSSHHDISPDKNTPLESKPVSQGYLKPGAPIRLSNNYKGKTSVNQYETIELTFSSAISGDLKILVHSADGIVIDGPIEETQTIDKNETVIIPVNIIAPNAGKYFLNIQAQVTTNENTQTRAFGLNILAGDKQPATTNSAIKSTAEDNIIIMQAQEPPAD